MLDQYRIPNYPNQEADEQLLFDTQSPEVVQPSYAWVHTVQQDIENLRAEADESVLIRDRIARLFRSVTQKLVAPAPGYTLERALIERESEIGASLFGGLAEGVTRRFWYYEGDWYFEERAPKAASVARYTVYEDSIEKLVHGRPVTLEPSETHALITAIPLYKARIEHELYHPAQAQSRAA